MKRIFDSKRNVYIAVICLMLIFSIASILTAYEKNYTFSEPVYVLNGYAYLTTGNSFQSGHPIFSNIISALPLLFVQVEMPPPQTIEHPLNFARREFYYYGNNNPELITFFSRLPFILLSIIFAYFVFRWASELFGAKAGVLALTLYIFHPLIIAQSGFAATDMAVAGFMFISFYYLWKYATSLSWKHLVICAICWGLAVSIKSSAFFLVPIYFLMLLIHKISLRRLLATLGILLITGAILFSLINIREVHPIYTQDDPFYLKSSEFRSKERLQELSIQLTSNDFLREKLIFVLTKIPVPGPHSFQAYAMQFLHSAAGHDQFFLGDYSVHGRWYYYFVSYLIQTPIALLLLLALSIIFFKKLISPNIRNEYFLVIPPLIFLLIFSFIIKLNLGLRHTLLVPLFGFVFISRVVNLKKRSGFIVLLLVVLYVFSSVFAFPHYIAYYNELVGGPSNGYKYDTEFDQGQDLKGLSKYLSEQGISNIKLRYAGFAKPSFYNISYQNFTTCLPTEGIIAISVSSLQGAFWTEGLQKRDLSCYSWLRELKPDANIGYSIFIYNVSKEELSVLGYGNP